MCRSAARLRDDARGRHAQSPHRVQELDRALPVLERAPYSWRCDARCPRFDSANAHARGSPRRSPSASTDSKRARASSESPFERSAIPRFRRARSSAVASPCAAASMPSSAKWLSASSHFDSARRSLPSVFRPLSTVAGIASVCAIPVLGVLPRRRHVARQVRDLGELDGASAPSSVASGECRRLGESPRAIERDARRPPYPRARPTRAREAGARARPRRRRTPRWRQRAASSGSPAASARSAVRSRSSRRGSGGERLDRAHPPGNDLAPRERVVDRRFERASVRTVGRFERGGVGGFVDEELRRARECPRLRPGPAARSAAATRARSTAEARSRRRPRALLPRRRDREPPSRPAELPRWRGAAQACVIRRERRRAPRRPTGDRRARAP